MKITLLHVLACINTTLSISTPEISNWYPPRSSCIQMEPFRSKMFELDIVRPLKQQPKTHPLTLPQVSTLPRCPKSTLVLLDTPEDTSFFIHSRHLFDRHRSLRLHHHAFVVFRSLFVVFSIVALVSFVLITAITGLVPIFLINIFVGIMLIFVVAI
ncbi:hypothetical protein IQ06DRAFT_19819 [Phaeosphaeriaceae sp. SRC1lsM3a]|nr:hypothetical protein IQ06DRAFT_19819 [Stagonospora sp. SRC1lsM3a]